MDTINVILYLSFLRILASFVIEKNTVSLTFKSETGILFKLSCPIKAIRSSAVHQNKFVELLLDSRRIFLCRKKKGTWIHPPSVVERKFHDEFIGLIRQHGGLILEPQKKKGGKSFFHMAAKLNERVVRNLESLKRLLPTVRGSTNPLECFESLFQQRRRLGNGTFGTVYLSTENKTGYCFASKVIDVRLGLMEYQTASKLRAHPSVCEVFGLFADLGQSTSYLLMEYCAGGDLFTLISENDIGEAGCRDVMIQLLSAVQYMHSLGIIHCDIKPENVFLKNRDTLEVKLGDFGGCFDTNDHQRSYTSYATGTAEYAAPEVWMALLPFNTYSFPADIWSLGVLFYICLTQRNLFHVGTFDRNVRTEEDIRRIEGVSEILDGVVNYQVSPFIATRPDEEVASPKCRNFLERMLMVDPNERATPEDLRNHPWIKQVKQEEQAVQAVQAVQSLNDSIC